MYTEACVPHGAKSPPEFGYACALRLGDDDGGAGGVNVVIQAEIDGSPVYQHPLVGGLRRELELGPPVDRGGGGSRG